MAAIAFEASAPTNLEKLWIFHVKQSGMKKIQSAATIKKFWVPNHDGFDQTQSHHFHVETPWNPIAEIAWKTAFVESVQMRI